MPKHSRKAVSSDMIIVIAFILIFAFLFAIMIMNTDKAATAGAEKLPKYKGYFNCRNLFTDWEYAKACFSAVVHGG
ncbi:Uncharacterised protein [uncultured archaeon]|nr:Uncharacterised protein [uncultured archaeon]